MLGISDVEIAGTQGAMRIASYLAHGEIRLKADDDLI